MRTGSAIILASLLTLTGHAQINRADSTVQVIGYWNRGDKETYSITEQTFRIQSGDTTSRDQSSYDVEITVADSTASSYTIEWLYKNFSVEGNNQLLKKLASASENMKVVIRTDEFGGFLEVANWQEVRDFMHRSVQLITSDLPPVPNGGELIANMVAMFSSKEAIESAAIKEIQQFYTFHGGRYKLDLEYSGKTQLPNIFGGEPFDAEMTVLLEEIDEEYEEAILRVWMTVDSDQATNASYEFLKKAAETSGLTPPTRESIPPVSIEDRTATQIHGPSGWVLYSISTREITAEGGSRIETRVIEIKE
ncbi:MAG: hypothetical protein KF749_14275 [Bacteroidetes bacterium]|nr:hypothetical protein [Bacteroidota bacterium]MCW5894085.1 hypothetical protein [Bacteroidota bacterium]